MDKNEFKQKLKHKNFDEETLELLYKATNEVVKTYGKYISEATILEHIDSNLDSVKLHEEKIDGGKSIGIYRSRTKKIEMIDNGEHTIFVHEFLHMITYSNNGKNDKKIGLSDPYSGVGINEAMTEIMVEEILGKNAGGYRETVQLAKIFLECLPIKEEVIKAYFEGDREVLKNALEKNGRVNLYSVISEFDNIYQKCKEANFYDLKYSEVEYFSSVLKDINTVEELEKKISILKRIDDMFEECAREQIEHDMNYDENYVYDRKSGKEYLHVILDDVKKLIEKGIPKERIEEVLKRNNILDEISNTVSKEEILQKDGESLFELLQDNHEELQKNHEYYGDIYFNEKIFEKLMGSNRGINSYDCNDVIIGLHEVQKKYPGISLDELKIGVTKIHKFGTKIIFFGNEQGLLLAIRNSVKNGEIVVEELQIAQKDGKYELEADYEKASEEKAKKYELDEEWDSCKYEFGAGDVDAIVQTRSSNIEILKAKIKEKEEEIIAYGGIIEEEEHGEIIGTGGNGIFSGFLESAKKELEQYKAQLSEMEAKTNKRKKAKLLADTIEQTESKVGNFDIIEEIISEQENSREDSIREDI